MRLHWLTNVFVNFESAACYCMFKAMNVISWKKITPLQFSTAPPSILSPWNCYIATHIYYALLPKSTSKPKFPHQPFDWLIETSSFAERTAALVRSLKLASAALYIWPARLISLHVFRMFNRDVTQRTGGCLKPENTQCIYLYIYKNDFIWPEAEFDKSSWSTSSLA